MNKADRLEAKTGKLHEVQMNFYCMDKKGIYEFINNELRGRVSVLDENEMYYALENGKLGEYNYCRIH